MTSAPTDFYPRPPRGGRRLYRHSQADVVNFYPRPPQGGRPLQFPLVRTDDVISIHALREEGDPTATPSTTASRYFYPRPPRGGRLTDNPPTTETKNFYPRPPRGGRRWAEARAVYGPPISIHALREEGDVPAAPTLSCTTNFYPRPPRGGRPRREQRRASG